MTAQAYIALAIQLMAPQLSRDVAKQYAAVIHQQSRARRLDPYLMVAVIAHESRLRAPLRYTAAGELYVGLGQIRARNYPECRESLDSESCKRRIASLQDGSTNLHQAAIVLDQSRVFCRKHLGRKPKIAEWLSVYQGYGGRPEVGGGFCLRTRAGKPAKMPKLTRRVLWMRACLYREVRRKNPRNLVCYPS